MKNSNFSRRTFVKSATLTGGLLLSPSFSLEAMANSSNNKKLKLALVGCGGRGTGAAVQALRADKDVELVAVADAFKDRIESSLKSIYEELDGEIEVKVKEKNRFVGFNSYQKAIDKALIMSSKLHEIWAYGALDQKRQLQNLVFPSGIGYNKQNDRVQTKRVNSIFSAIPLLTKDLDKIKNGEPINFDHFSALVTPTGFKPVTS